MDAEAVLVATVLAERRPARALADRMRLLIDDPVRAASLFDSIFYRLPPYADTDLPAAAAEVMRRVGRSDAALLLDGLAAQMRAPRSLPDDAEAAARVIVAADNPDERLHYALLDLECEQRWAQLAALFERVWPCVKPVGYFWVHLRMSRVYAELGRHDAARLMAALAVQIDPTSRDARQPYVCLLEGFRAVGRLRDAAELVEHQFALNPDFPIVQVETRAALLRAAGPVAVPPPTPPWRSRRPWPPLPGPFEYEVNSGSERAESALEIPAITVSASILAFQEDVRGPAGITSVVQIAPAGEYVRPPPQVLETGDLDGSLKDELEKIYRSAVQPYDAAKLIALKGALIAGQGCVVTRGNLLFRESVAEFLANGEMPEGLKAGSHPSHFSLRSGVTRSVEGQALLLKRPWWRNYGHWLVDAASALALVPMEILPKGCQIIMGKFESPAMRDIALETAAKLAPGLPVLEHPDEEVWQVEGLLYPLPVSIPPLFKHPRALERLRGAILRGQMREGTPGRRLFVTRGSHPARRLINEDEIKTIAEAAGYEVVQPETLSLTSQAELFHSAACIVGVKGAALTNIIFCREGVRLLLLSPGDFIDPFFWDLAAHAGASYGELFGPLTDRRLGRSRNSFTVDAERFRELLPP